MFSQNVWKLPSPVWADIQISTKFERSLGEKPMDGAEFESIEDEEDVKDAKKFVGR